MMKENEGEYSHVSLPLDLIENLENGNGWDEGWSWPTWTFDEEEMWWIGLLAPDLISQCFQGEEEEEITN